MLKAFKLSKQRLSGVMAALVLISLSAYADLYQNQPSNPSSYSNEYKGTQSNSKVSDQDLTKTIRDKISSGWFSKGYDQLNVRVNSGIVTLSGAVKTESDKEKVEKEVRSIEGVRAVNNQIVIRDPNAKESQRNFLKHFQWSRHFKRYGR